VEAMTNLSAHTRSRQQVIHHVASHYTELSWLTPKICTSPKGGEGKCVCVHARVCVRVYVCVCVRACARANNVKSHLVDYVRFRAGE